MDGVRRYHITYSVDGGPELVPDPTGGICLVEEVLASRGCPKDPPRMNVAYGVVLAVLFAVFFIGVGIIVASTHCHQ